MSRPEKMVMIGDELSVDVVFGNMNNMLTVWYQKVRNEFNEYS